MATNRERAFRVAQECGAGDDWAARYTNALAAAGLLAPDPEPRYWMDEHGCIYDRTTNDRCVANCSGGGTQQRDACLAALNALDEADRG